MAINNSTRLNQGIPDRVSQGGRGQAATKVADPSAARALPDFGRTAEHARRDPYDLRGAFSRLSKLLRLDGLAGPRKDVPTRGFYLNILV